MKSQSIDFEEEEEEEDLNQENIQENIDIDSEDNNLDIVEEEEDVEKQEYIDIFYIDKHDDLNENHREYEKVKNDEESAEEEEEKCQENNTNSQVDNFDDNDKKKITELINKIQIEIDKKENDVQKDENDKNDIQNQEEEEEQNDAINFLSFSMIKGEREKRKQPLNNFLLNTINSIGSTNFQFADILKACQIENLVKFLEIFFKENKDIRFLEDLIIKKESTYSQKMREIIGFLGEKKAIFKVLLFDFDNPKLEEPSSILLYTKILDLFFLKRSKSEMLDICEFLLFTEIDENDTLYNLLLEIKKNRKQRKKILYDWNTYLALVYYANEDKIHFKKDQIPPGKYSFKTKHIPMIINEAFLKQIDIDQSPLYYQLQFIFDEIEKNIDAHKSFNDFIKSKEKNENVKCAQQNVNSHKSMNEKIETFKYRIFMHSLNLSKSMRHKEVGSVSKFEDYWNKNYDKSSFRKGIFDFKQNEQSDLWNDAFNNCQTMELTENEKKSKKKEMEFISKDPNKSIHLFYKLFVYKDNKWQINAEEFEKFETNLFKDQENHPLVLLFDSDNKNIKSLSSNLAYPISNFTKENGSDQIFVYALYGNSLKKVESFNLFYLNFTEKVESFDPIYLILHVPKLKIKNKSKTKSKKKSKKLNTIIYQIYYFLCTICDIKIVVLNKDYYNDQINLVDKFDTIYLSYKNPNDPSKKTKNENSNSNGKDNKDLSSDGDEIDENDEDESNINDDEKDNDNDFVKRINSINKKLNICDKKPNCIFLANSYQIKDSFKRKDQTQLFKNLEDKIKNCNCYFHFINVKKISTYFEFIATLSQLAFDCKDCTNERTLEKLRCIELANISGYYIQYKLGIDLDEPLKNMIDTRFSQYKLYNDSFKSYLCLLAQLNNELTKTYPSVDTEYNEKCNSIISEIKNELTTKYQKAIIGHLKISAENSLNYWKKKINGQVYWSIEDRNNVRSNHVNFLKSEYFDIISAIFQPKELSHVFNGNYSVLTEQIELDNLKFIDLFNEFDNKIVNENNQQKVENIGDLRDKATNYMIREKENVREIKAIVESDKLDEIFESDF